MVMYPDGMATPVTITVPAPLDKALPYLKFIASLVVTAGPVVGAVVALPMWALIVLALAAPVATYMTPNIPVAPELPPAEPRVLRARPGSARPIPCATVTEPPTQADIPAVPAQ